VVLEPLAPMPPPAPVEEEGPRPYATVTMGLFYYQFFGIGIGATAGGHLLPQTVLEIDVYRAASLAPTQASESIAIRLQQMAGKHVYVRGGVRYRRLELTSILDFGDYEERLIQRDAGADVGVGFRWDRSNFVLGLDVLGIYMPIQSFFTEEQTRDKTNGELLAVRDPGLRERWDVRLAYVHLGARF
jgi:hypothetical protein